MIFGPVNPLRVAERQLNKAKLDLLEVQAARENIAAQEAALMDRIARLQAMVASYGTSTKSEDKAENWTRSTVGAHA